MRNKKWLAHVRIEESCSVVRLAVTFAIASKASLLGAKTVRASRESIVSTAKHGEW
jgi:hypothetical protein